MPYHSNRKSDWERKLVPGAKLIDMRVRFFFKRQFGVSLIYFGFKGK